MSEIGLLGSLGELKIYLLFEFLDETATKISRHSTGRFIAKSSSKESIVEALESVFAGNVYLPADIMRLSQGHEVKNEFVVLPEKIALLTRRELTVLKNLSQGEANKQIAFNLHISEATVKSHVSSILKKLGASNRVKVVLGCSEIDFNHY
jgi:DNA-binding NarL/FixJ family response regulator